MPESIKSLLHDIGADGAEPDRDLAAGAYRRARAIGRRRFAAGSVGAVAALALAGAATNAYLNGDRDGPQAADTAPTQVQTDPGPGPTWDTAELENCGPPEDWDGWGSSDSLRVLTELPKGLLFQETAVDGGAALVLGYGDAWEPMTAPGPEFAYAPDGERYVTWSGGVCDGTLESTTGGTLSGLGIWTETCEPSWSPDSDRVVLNYPAGAGGAYVLDVVSGKARVLPDEVGCSPRWSADGKWLVSGDGATAMRPDGGETRLLAGAVSWIGEPGFLGLSSISADLSRACLAFAEGGDRDVEVEGGEGGWSGAPDAYRCDRYVDTATGEVLELVEDGRTPQVVFLADGSMILVEPGPDEVRVQLVGADWTVLDERSLPGRDGPGPVLRGYYTG